MFFLLVYFLKSLIFFDFFGIASTFQDLGLGFRFRVMKFNYAKK
jgi:hypothetical protein